MSNPIVQRELIGTLRSPRALAVQVSLVLLLALLVVLRWPSEGRVELAGAESQNVLRVFGYGLMAGLMLLTPIFPAISIVRERQQGTLALLLNSRMNPWSIMLGKLAGSLAFIVVLILLSVPAAAACFAMGGIDLTGQLLLMYLVLLVLAMMYATLGLLVSSFARTTDGALRAVYGLILVLGVFTVAPYRFFAGANSVAAMQARLIESVPGVGAGLSAIVGAVFGALESLGLSIPVMLDWLRSISPLPAMMEALGDTGVGGAGVIQQGGAAWKFIVIGLICTVIFSVWTAVRLGGRMLDHAREAGTITDDRSAGQRAYRRIMYLWFFDPQRRSGLIGPTTNPLFVKEQRCRKFGRGHWMMRLLVTCVIVSLGLMLAATMRAAGQGVETLGGILVLLQVSLLILITPSLASGLISAERESRGWQLLQMTPMSAGRIVRGKLMSAGVTLLLVLVATLPGYAVLIAIKPETASMILTVIGDLILIGVMALLISAAVSSLCSKTATATAVAYGVLVTLCGVTMLIWLGRGAPFGHELVQAVLIANPLAGALNLINAPGFDQYNIFPGQWWFLGGVCVLALVVLTVQTWRLTRPS